MGAWSSTISISDDIFDFHRNLSRLLDSVINEEDDTMLSSKLKLHMKW